MAAALCGAEDLDVAYLALGGGVPGLSILWVLELSDINIHLHAVDCLYIADLCF